MISPSDAEVIGRSLDEPEAFGLIYDRHTVVPDDLPFYTRLHALPEVVEHLCPEGRPRSPEETNAWMEYTLASYEQLALGYLAVVRKADGALIGRCGRDHARDELRLVVRGLGHSSAGRPLAARRRARALCRRTGAVRSRAACLAGLGVRAP